MSFPRTRGDGPPTTSAFTFALVFSPHARGWTDRALKLAPLGPVFPARAGMDRAGAALCYRRCCFPRTRGDGPTSETLTLETTLFSPHARGWT